MTNEDIKQEFSRWIDSCQPKVWYKLKNLSNWSITNNPTWNSFYNIIYIVDDEHAELRKLQIDKPDTEFQLQWITGEWYDCSNIITWSIDIKYRIKPKKWYDDPEMVGKPVWVKYTEGDVWQADIFLGYVKNCSRGEFKCKRYDWKYAKPIIPEDCYQGVMDEK